MGNIDRELKEVDQRLERSIAEVQSQYEYSIIVFI
jgi:hypothetical protein